MSIIPSIEDIIVYFLFPNLFKSNADGAYHNYAKSYNCLRDNFHRILTLHERKNFGHIFYNVSFAIVDPIKLI